VKRDLRRFVGLVLVAMLLIGGAVVWGLASGPEKRGYPTVCDPGVRSVQTLAPGTAPCTPPYVRP